MTNPAQPTPDGWRLAFEAIAEVRAWYSEKIFPESGTSKDCESASLCRLTCDNIKRKLEEAIADTSDSLELVPNAKGEYILGSCNPDDELATVRRKVKA